jgi:hypothetical protein
MKLSKVYRLDEAKKPDQMTDEEQVDMVSRSPLKIQHIKDPCCKAQVEAVWRHLDVIKFKFIKNPCEGAQIVAVEKDPTMLRFFPNAPQTVKDAAIVRIIRKAGKNEVSLLDKLPTVYDQTGKSFSEEGQLKAVTNNPDAIILIIQTLKITPNEEVQLAAVSKKGQLVTVIKNPSQKVLNVALADENFIKQPTAYENYLKKQFKDNTIMQNKWSRYAENVRSM